MCLSGAGALQPDILRARGGFYVRVGPRRAPGAGNSEQNLLGSVGRLLAVTIAPGVSMVELGVD